MLTPITPLNASGLTGQVAISNGGTGAATAAAGLNALASVTSDPFGVALLSKTTAALVRSYIGAGTGAGDALTTNPLSQFAATTSAQLAGVLSDETGSGAAVFATSPTLVTPLLGTPTSGNLANCTGYPGIPSAANPSASLGLSAVNGSASTFLRSDGAPAIDLTMAPTWTGVHSFATAARSSGVAPFLRIVTPADTAQTASTESIGIAFGGTNASPPATASRQYATGALVLHRENVFTAPTLTAVGASTITTAVTLAVTGAPVAGTNATITNGYSIMSQGGIIGIRQAGSTTNECTLIQTSTYGGLAGPGGSVSSAYLLLQGSLALTKDMTFASSISDNPGNGVRMGTTEILFATGYYLGFASSNTPTSSRDVSFYRDSAGVLKVGTGAASGVGKLATVVLKAGTATAATAPLKLTSGTSMTTAEAGAMEYDGTNLFFTRTGTTRETNWCGNDAAAAPSTASIGVILDYFGTSATRVLTTPNSWASVNIGGTTYKVPLYS